MDYAVLLFSYIVIGVVISICISFINMMLAPIVDIKKYSLFTGLVLSALVFTAFNMGILTTLNIPIEGVTIQPYFHYVDIGLTCILGIGGAKGFRMFIKKINK